MKRGLLALPLVFLLTTPVMANEARNTTDTNSTGIGLSENSNQNILLPQTGISQDFSSDGNSIDNSRTNQTYIAPDNLPPEANQYRFEFSGGNANLSVKVHCPAGGGFAVNFGTYLGGFGLSTPSDELPEDCDLSNLNEAQSVDIAVLAVKNLSPEFQRVFFEQLLLKKMKDMGIIRTNTQGRILLEGLVSDYAIDSVIPE